MNNDPMVNKLVKRRDHNVSQVEAIKNAAVDGERDLTSEELESIETYKRDISEVDRQLAIVGDDLQMEEGARTRLASIAPSAAAPSKYRSAGEVVYDILHQADPEARARYSSAIKRAAQHMGTDKAITEATAGDLLGLAVIPNVGPVIQPFFDDMPFIRAIGARPLPQAGAGFNRPYIVDPSINSGGVGVQATQKAELVSAAFEVESDLHKPVTYGGYLNVSAQLMHHQAGALDIIVRQLQRRLGLQLEAAAVAELAATTGVIDTGATPTGPDLIGFMYDASANVYDATGQLAEWAVMGPAGWAMLGKAVDAAGRPLLPFLTPVNAQGSMRADTFQATGPAGLQTVVSHAIADDSIYVGNGMGIECYLYNYPALEAVEPSVLGRQIAVAADMVVARPTPVANSVQRVYDAT